MNASDATTMGKVRRLVEESGLTYQEIGERMKYPSSTARQSVWQFLRCVNPQVGTLKRFAEAMGVKVESLL